MPAPKRLRVLADDLAVSAFILPPIEAALEGKPVCKACAPLRTKMQHLCQLRMTLKDGVEVYEAFECLRCHTQWAIVYLELREGAAE